MWRCTLDVLKIDNLFARRSIRSFTDQPVSEEQIEMLLKAAMAAPSCGNCRPWHFVVITDQGMREALLEAHPWAQMLAEAPVCIVPCGQPSMSYPGANGYWIVDLCAATENILLAAVGLGLGAVWCGVYPLEDRITITRRILGLPEEVIPVAYIPVGYPAETKAPRTQYDPGCVHRDRW